MHVAATKYCSCSSWIVAVPANDLHPPPWDWVQRSVFVLLMTIQYPLSFTPSFRLDPEISLCTAHDYTVLLVFHPLLQTGSRDQCLYSQYTLSLPYVLWEKSWLYSTSRLSPLPKTGPRDQCLYSQYCFSALSSVEVMTIQGSSSSTSSLRLAREIGVCTASTHFLPSVLWEKSWLYSAPRLPPPLSDWPQISVSVQVALILCPQFTHFYRFPRCVCVPELGVYRSSPIFIGSLRVCPRLWCL